jgi:hypothetical protein
MEFCAMRIAQDTSFRPTLDHIFESFFEIASLFAWKVSRHYDKKLHHPSQI